LESWRTRNVELRVGWVDSCATTQSEENAVKKRNTSEGTLDDIAGQPDQVSCLMRFTLFPPHDNVMVANEKGDIRYLPNFPLP